MKSLVGNHFHFTAFGQDWIKERWLARKPPTYRQFADFWQKEYKARQKKPAAPKKEWAYINFTRALIQKNPNATRKEISAGWKKERLAQVQKAKDLLGL